MIVDPVEIPSFVDNDPKNNFLLWPYCSGGEQAKGKDEDCSVNFKYGMKRDFNNWLASLGPSAPVKTLTELRQWNLAHAKAGAIKYGPIAHRHLRRDGRWQPTAPATTRTSRKTRCSAARGASMRCCRPIDSTRF